MFEIDGNTEVQYLRGSTVLSIKVPPTAVGKLCGRCSSNDDRMVDVTENVVHAL